MGRGFILYSAFLISGGAAILYELLWIRLLALTFGGVTATTAGVASLFLAGLALGAWLGGRIVDLLVERKTLRSLFFGYFGLEVGIGLWAILNWFLFSEFAHQPGSWHLGVAGALVFGQTAVMGATWPAMFKLLLGLGEDWRVAGKIAFLNTIGGAFGAFLASFFLLANLGVLGALKVGFAGNLLAGGLVATMGLGVKRGFSLELPQKDHHAPASGKRDQGWMSKVLIILGVAGFVGMALEIFWLRAFALTVGSSIYSFTLVLTVILLGLALGGLLARYLKVDLGLLLWVIWLEAIFIFLGMVILPRVPYLLVSWYTKTGNTFFQANLMRLSLVALVALIPSVLSGMILPLGVTLLKTYFGRAGERAGLAYFFNTLGAVLGGILAALVLLPYLGLQIGIIFLAGFLGLVACFFFWLKKAPAKLTLVLLIFLASVGFWGARSWNQKDLASGAFLYGLSVLEKTSGSKLLYYQDGREVTVTTTWHKGVTTLRLNGKADASDENDMGTQAVLGHVPVLLHQDPKNVLVIGLGSGVTAGAISKHKRVEKITVVEIEPVVVEAAGKYFAEENYEVLKNPKTKLFIGDGRNFLLETNQRFEVITSEPSNPWIAGEANLFTKEFFEIGRNRLSEEGVFFQWLHLYNLRPSEVKSIIATFKAVFPYVQIWTSTNPVDIFLAGKTRSFILSWDRFQEALDTPGVRESLARRGFADEIRLFSLLWARTEVVEKLAQGGEVNSDKQPILEYRAPLGLYEETLVENFALLLNFFQEGGRILEIEGIPEEMVVKMKKARQARHFLVQARTAREKGNLEEAIILAEGGWSQDGEAPSLKRYLAQLYLDRGVATADLSFYEKAIELNERYYPAFLGLISGYLEKGNLEKSEKIIKEGQEKFPWSGEMLMYAGILAGMRQDNQQAEKLLLRARELEPWNVLIYNNLAHLYYLQGKKDLALEHWQASLKINPRQPEIRQMVRYVERLKRLK